MDGTRAFVDRLTSWSPVLLLGCLAALTYWLDAQVQPSPAHRDGSSRHDPDLFLVDFRAVNFDANGKPIESLSAVRGDHYPDDDSIALTKPNFKITQPDKPAFSIDADRGTVSGDRENVFFNGNVRADFQPKKNLEVGQCVHKLLIHPADPKMLYQQNHCGVYRARWNAAKWTDVSRGLPTRFGFALALPAAEKQTLFTVPIESAEFRCNPEGKFRVACSRNGGKSWEFLTNGLPQRNAHLTVFRDAMSADALSPAGVYVGTETGTLFYSRDSGRKWQVLAEYLPPIYSVSAYTEA